MPVSKNRSLKYAARFPRLVKISGLTKLFISIIQTLRGIWHHYFITEPFNSSVSQSQGYPDSFKCADSWNQSFSRGPGGMGCLGQIFHPEEQDLAQSPDTFHTPAQTPQGSLLAPGRSTISLGKVLLICALLFSGKAVLRE